MNKNVVVIAGGFSVKSYDLWKIPTGPLLIGVNDAAYQFPVHHALTMDRKWFEYRYFDLIKRPGIRKLWIRQGINKIIPQLDPKVVEFECDNEAPCILSPRGNTFHGSNSGTVAINLAYQLSLANIFLLGFDMQKGPNEEPYWYPPYPWNAKGGTKPGNYRTWAAEFEAIARQLDFMNLTGPGIKLYNVNHRSAIDAFPKMTFEKMLKELG